MDLVELRKWELTPEFQGSFSAWNEEISHHGWIDVRNDDIQFTIPGKPLTKSRVALVSTGGVHLKSQRPFNILSRDGDWSIRPVPSDTPVSELAITHSHYNHGDADADVNCMFPIERVRELAQSSFIGSVSRTFFGMMGFIPNGTHVVEEAAPEIARQLKADGTDVVLLTPS